MAAVRAGRVSIRGRDGGGFSVYYDNVLVGSASEKPAAPDRMVSTVRFIVAGGVWANGVAGMLMVQTLVHEAGLLVLGFGAGENAGPAFAFEARLPLDVVFGWTRDNLTALHAALELTPQQSAALLAANPNASASVFAQPGWGRTAYRAYLWLDLTLAIPLYVAVHRLIVQALYSPVSSSVSTPVTPDNTTTTANDDDFSDTISPLAFKAPFALAILDAFETVGLLIACYSQDNFLSDDYLAKLQAANNAKVIIFFVLVGLEFSGFLKSFLSNISTEIRSTGITAKAPSASVDAKRKARLEKKKLEKKAE
ncbi:hypothetical protein HK100_005612 [Physocladia obscura]|uniref:Uncharacterized protein n=1 Tax=Physocladia obscura TaxID=109957 RepID=A0AAD5SX45_9FUNG|nr:hypothetical protein HK100_005612 [Physocladia obscura]